MPIHGYPGNIITANQVPPTVNSASGVWTTEQQLQYQTAGNWPMPLQQVSRSLRFNSADSAYLNRTPSVASNRKTWTWSGWVKRSALGVTQGLFGAYSAANNTDNLWFGFSGGDLFIISRNSDELRRTTQVFRDASAWYHIVVVLDTTQATANDRVKIYLNGTQITVFTTTNNPTQNDNQGVNQAAEHRIGRRPDSTDYLSAYCTEVNFIDGQALTPSSFGFFDVNGIWQPRQYTGTYGTNGFFLNFSDNSNTTAATLGKDYSGNGNNWTPNNFSVTAGAGNDSLVDTPTNYGTDTGAGGEVRGNYATLNATGLGGGTLSNGNLDAVFSSATGRLATFLLSAGSWYWETNVTTLGSADFLTGIIQDNATTAAIQGNVNPIRVVYQGNGNIRKDGSLVETVASYTSGDVIGISFNASTREIKFYKNNSLVSTQTATSGYQYVPWVGQPGVSSATISMNFGQRPFAYTAPSGFKALCTQNLPEPTIVKGGEYFNTVLYTGTGSSQTISGVGFQPDFTWIKSRSNTTWHALHDAVRGSTKELFSNSTSQEFTNADSVTSFNSNGFSLGADTAGGSVNVNTYTYVAWNWKANGAGSTNTAGSITSTVSVNTTSGFSIVSYTGTGSTATVGHGLGVAPSMVIVKKRSATGNWVTWHSGLTGGSPEDRLIYLDLTNAQTTVTDYWGTNGMTSTTFGVWATGGDNNASGSTFVAYCFAQVAGYSAFGSYTGNGSTDGPFVYTGFRPRFVLVKNLAVENWWIMDSARNTYNVADLALFPALSNAEGSGSSFFTDFLSNGFKLRANASAINNANGNTYIYMAFAENPFKISRAR